MKTLCLTLTLALMLVAHTAFAQTAIPDFNSCPALKDESKYTKKYSNYSMLLQGKDGWVFRTKNDFVSEFEINDVNLALFTQLNEQLKKRGTTLVVALMPTRAMAVPDMLPVYAGYDPAMAKTNYNALIKKMNDAGIIFVGTPEMKAAGRYFYKADQHWTTAGAQEMAQALAGKIKTLSAYRGLKNADFKTIPLKETTFKGRFNEALNPLCGFIMPLETDTLTITQASSATASEESLFGDQPEPDVVLVGTSNSKKNDNDLNFDGYLKEALSTDVSNEAVTGGGLDDSIITYLASDKFHTQPPKVLIWEIPGYYKLGGGETEKALRQAIPSVYGVCKSPVIEGAPVKLSSGEVTILETTGKNINVAGSYLMLDFDSPPKKNFSGMYNYSGKNKENFKFNREAKVRISERFFYLPRGKKKESLEGIALKVPSELSGLTVQARICRQP